MVTVLICHVVTRPTLFTIVCAYRLR